MNLMMQEQNAISMLDWLLMMVKVFQKQPTHPPVFLWIPSYKLITTYSGDLNNEPLNNGSICITDISVRYLDGTCHVTGHVTWQNIQIMDKMFFYSDESSE